MFLGAFGAGPDPNTMTCAAIIKGYNTNVGLAKTRSGQHAKNAQTRVAELEPFYQKCKAASDGVTPDQPVELPPGAITPGQLVSGGVAPGGYTSQAGFSLDWKLMGMLVGGGAALLILLSLLKKKRGGGVSAPRVARAPSKQRLVGMKDVMAVSHGAMAKAARKG